MKTHNSAYITL